jgi:signal transduction histidine kinase
VISNEMNSFDELLKKMIAIIMSNSGAESGAIIIKEGHFGIAAYSTRSNTCETYEPPIPLNDDNEQVSSLIVHYVIHTHAMLFIPNVEEDARFATGSQGSHLISVICMPIMHKNTLVGVLYLQANLNTFTYKHANVLALLCDQIGISITNALLFKSVQKATKANARMIESQLQALEEARASREQALRATKMKSNFLANMCKFFFYFYIKYCDFFFFFFFFNLIYFVLAHELRTPFSGFYGMISLLSETRLDNEQREFVSIAKQSCEMLLHIIGKFSLLYRYNIFNSYHAIFINLFFFCVR